MRWIKLYWRDALALASITALVIGFFFRLFFPVPQLIVTPDFGRSDSWHFSFPTKYLLGQSLHRNELPLWTPSLGSGFPLFAEGQTGTLYLPNLLLFRLFDPVNAYNLSLVLAVAMLGWGMYVWLRMMNYDPFPAVATALTVSLSGMVMAQLPHIALIQGFSLLPWVGAATLYLTRTTKAIILWALVASQQIFTGFPQASFITILFSAAYYGWLIRKSPTKLSRAGWFLLALVATVGLSAVQLLPSWEFLKQTTVAGGLEPDAASYFSYPIKHLITLIAPFALGNPKMGTYPAFFRFNGSIFWENVGGIGLLPIMLFFIFVITAIRKHTLFFLLTALISLLLMLGKYSPLYLVYSFFPFNLFRVPSRFIWMFVLLILILAAEGWARLWQMKPYQTGIRLALVAAFVLNTIFLFGSWYSYHAVKPAVKWLTPPPLAATLSNRRVLTVGADMVHNKTFLSSGWQTTDAYFFLRNALAPDANVLWSIPQAQVYAGRFLKRPSILDALISRELSVDDQAATVSALGKKLLDIASIQTLISALPLSQTGLEEATHVWSGSDTITAWNNPGSLPRAYLATIPVVATTKEEAYQVLSRDDFVPGKTVIVETPLTIPQHSAQTATTDISVTQLTDTSLDVSIKGNRTDGVLVLTDTYYPGWLAILDDQRIPIFPVNIRQMGVRVPPGNHTVRFQYAPESFFLGAWISTLSVILLMALWAFPAVFGAVRTVRKAVVRVWGHRYSRGT